MTISGIDRLLADPTLLAQFAGKRVALVAHPASLTKNLMHSLDALIASGVNITAAFGPQHGIKGDKQDNMVETADEIAPLSGLEIRWVVIVAVSVIANRLTSSPAPLPSTHASRL